MILWFLACAPPASEPDPEPGPTLLRGPALLRRISLDLRGIPPDVAELDAVEDDPSLVWTYRDQYLDDPLLEERLIEIFNLDFHTLINEFEWSWGDLFPNQEMGRHYAQARQVGEEPLRYMARIAIEDRPWTEVVTGDTTMATPLLASFTPVDYDPADTGWEEVHYDDGRPSAGVLAMNAMWWRYESNFANFNRSRAAAITRILLCRDMFERTVSFSSTGGALSTDEIDDAVHNQAECLACHATLDPLSATMFGFYTSAAEIVTYRPEREALGPEMLEVEKAYYGTPVESLADVGELIAADPRFPRCTTQHMAQALWARDLEDGDAATIDGLDADFVRGGLLLKPLLAAITETEEYRLGAVALDTPEDDLPDYAAARMMPPDMLADAVEEATGFRWVIGETDLMSEDDDGFRQIAGGVDGISQLRTQRVPGVMWTLVVKRLAEAAAGHVVDRASDGEPLFAHALLTTRSTDPEFALEVEELWWHLTATRLTDAEVQAYADLFDTVEALDGTESAWQSVIAAMLRDPAFLFY